ncbi:hypothetical protein VPHD148_0312 [Vibrio phage D148]
MYNSLYRQTTCEPSLVPQTPGLHMVRGEEHIVLPAEFPTQQDVYSELLNAVREAIATNVMRPVHRQLEPILGELKDAFDTSIMYREVGMEGSTDLFTGAVAVQQVLGRILYDDSIMSAFIGDTNNCLMNEHSTYWTNVYHSSRQGSRVRVEHIMPRHPVAIRYLRRTDAEIQDTDNEIMMKVVWWAPYDGSNMSGVTRITDNLASILTVYYKLLTRFPTCQSYSNDLPGFVNS